ncbi:unnamed protein product [Acanthocheilonema viteae]|uniref:Uncharacterized protein n=1 Tax=Acanthocheilonema viteae TaxID=6277 RepID=A0A498SY31_ACAVI|nr:unnamed protein product [Acanthocheilonema viteae]
MYDLIIYITLLLFINVSYTVSLICYTVHWDSYSSFTEKSHKCNDGEEFCASLYDRGAQNWYLRAIPLDRKCYSTAELRNRINCSMNEFKEGCFLDPRYNSYIRSAEKLPVCICKNSYCNTQEKIESVWLEQNLYRFHEFEDCNDKLNKEKLTTKSEMFSDATLFETKTTNGASKLNEKAKPGAGTSKLGTEATETTAETSQSNRALTTLTTTQSNTETESNADAESDSTEMTPKNLKTGSRNDAESGSTEMTPENLKTGSSDAESGSTEMTPENLKTGSSDAESGSTEMTPENLKTESRSDAASELTVLNVGTTEVIQETT